MKGYGVLRFFERCIAEVVTLSNYTADLSPPPPPPPAAAQVRQISHFLAGLPFCAPPSPGRAEGSRPATLIYSSFLRFVRKLLRRAVKLRSCTYAVYGKGLGGARGSRNGRKLGRKRGNRSVVLHCTIVKSFGH